MNEEQQRRAEMLKKQYQAYEAQLDANPTRAPRSNSPDESLSSQSKGLTRTEPRTLDSLSIDELQAELVRREIKEVEGKLLQLRTIASQINVRIQELLDANA